MSTRPIPTLSLPRSTISTLSRAGYDTTQGLTSFTPEDLPKDPDTPIAQFQSTLPASQRVPVTQSAASMMDASNDMFHCCPPVDKLLGGGLTRGHILELSGPPGTSKGTLVLSIIQEYVKHGEEVLLIDPQNMTTPGTLDRFLRQSSSIPSHYRRLVHALDISTIPELMTFLHNLSSLLDMNPKITLLVLGSLSFFFQTSPSFAGSFAWRKSLLERIKPIFTKACVTQKLSIVITSQLATKMIKQDGTNANYDSASKAIMVPYLSDPHLPSSRTYRIIIVPESRTYGVLRLISSPSSPTGKSPSLEEQYRMVDGRMQMY